MFIAIKTWKPRSSIYVIANNDATPADPLEADLEGGAFGTASSFDLLAGGSGDIEVLTFGYTATDGTVATGTLAVDEFGVASCHAVGHITVG